MDGSTQASCKEEISERRYVDNITSPPSNQTRTQSNHLISNKNSNVKQKQIPGISFILIQSKRDESSNNKRTIQYDCVLCDDSKLTFLDGAAMKAHVASRKHLLNVLEIENKEKYEIYKNDLSKTSAMLVSEIYNCQSSLQRIITTPENHMKKRKILASEILRRRKAQSSATLNRISDIKVKSETVQADEEIIFIQDSQAPVPSKILETKEITLSKNSDVKDKNTESVKSDIEIIRFKNNEVPKQSTIPEPKKGNFSKKSCETIDGLRTFDKIVIFLSSNYSENKKIFLRDKVSVIVLKSTSYADTSEIKHYVTRCQQRTLFLLCSEICDIANANNSHLCSVNNLNCSSLGLEPLSVIKPISYKQTDVLCEAWHFRRIINEINPLLSPGSAISILPPLPPIIMNDTNFESAHRARHRLVSKRDKWKLYLVKGSEIEIFRKTFTLYSEALISLSILKLSEIGISSETLQKYSNIASMWDFHITHHKNINKKISLDKFNAYCDFVNLFFETCLGKTIRLQEQSQNNNESQKKVPHYEDSSENKGLNKAMLANNCKLHFNIEKVSNKIPFKHVYIVGNNELNSVLEGIVFENVEHVQWCESISWKRVPSLIKQMGKIKHKSVCLLALDLLYLASEAVSPDCKRLKCKNPVAVKSLATEEEDINEMTISSYLLNKMVEVMEFVSKLSPYFSVIMLPLFPVKIALESSVSHKLKHSVCGTNFYMVDGKKKNWKAFDKVARQLWHNYLKSNNKNYFVAEELQKLITETCGESSILVEPVNCPSLNYPEISLWRNILEAILKILLPGTCETTNLTVPTHFISRREQSRSPTAKRLTPTKILVLGDSEAKVFQNCKPKLRNKYNVDFEVKFQEGWRLCDLGPILRSHLKEEHNVVLLFGLTHYFWKMERLPELKYRKVQTPLTNGHISQVPSIMNKIVGYSKSVNNDVLVYLVIPSLKNMYLYNDLDSKASNNKAELLANHYFELYGEETIQKHCKKMYSLTSELKNDNYMWEDKLLLNANFAFDEFHKDEEYPPRASFLQGNCTIRELKLPLLHDGFHYRDDFVDFFFKAHAPILPWLHIESLSGIKDPVNKINQIGNATHKDSTARNMIDARSLVNSVSCILPALERNSKQFSNPKCSKNLDLNFRPAGNAEKIRNNNFESLSCILPALKLNASKYSKPECSLPLTSSVSSAPNIRKLSTSCIQPGVTSRVSSAPNIGKLGTSCIQPGVTSRVSSAPNIGKISTSCTQPGVTSHSNFASNSSYDGITNYSTPSEFSGTSAMLQEPRFKDQLFDFSGKDSYSKQPNSSVCDESEQRHYPSQPLTCHSGSENSFQPELTSTYQSDLRSKRSRSRSSSISRKKKHRSESPPNSQDSGVTEEYWSSLAHNKSGNLSGSDCSRSLDSGTSDYNVTASTSKEFSVEGTIALLEQISQKLGVLGPAMMAIVCRAKTHGTNSTKTLNLFVDDENIQLLSLAIDKLKALLRSESSTDSQVIATAIDWLSKLMEVAISSPRSPVDLNIEELALITVNKSVKFILNLIKLSFVNKGYNPTIEDISTVYTKVCELHFQIDES